MAAGLAGQFIRATLAYRDVAKNDMALSRYRRIVAFQKPAATVGRFALYGALQWSLVFHLPVSFLLAAVAAVSISGR